MSHPSAPPAVTDHVPAPYRGVMLPALHAEDRERLEYLRTRLREALPPTPAGSEQAAEYLLLVIERLVERGDEWALRVQRYWASDNLPIVPAASRRS